MYRSKNPQEFPKYSGKFGALTVDAIEQLFIDGVCFQHYINQGSVLEGCSANQSQSVNPELLPYPQDPPLFEHLKSIYKEEKEQKCLCPSAEAEKRKESM